MATTIAPSTEAQMLEGAIALCRARDADLALARGDRASPRRRAQRRA